jgi:NADH dehydrogenase
VPFPFSLWHVIGYVAEALPSPPLTRNQVELMGQDNISEPGAPGFEALQISPQSIEIMLSGAVAGLASTLVVEFLGRSAVWGCG